MTVRLAHPIGLICAFTWLGFVCAISFMEAWLKFKAHGVTLPIGLGIGRLVFQALNKVEWILAIAILVDVLWKRGITRHALIIMAPVILLALQTFWLLPVLDERALQVIHGQGAGTSNTHFMYVAFEIVKVTMLAIFGIGLFKTEPPLARVQT
jgi:hypothetical protein